MIMPSPRLQIIDKYKNMNSKPRNDMNMILKQAEYLPDYSKPRQELPKH